MTKKQTNRTAAQFLADLERDPEYVEQRRQREHTLAAERAELAKAEAPLVEALASSGASVTSVWDLVNTTRSYSALLPVLLEHLDRPYPEKIREGIARALAVPESQPYWHEIADRFEREDGSTTKGVKWALHLVLSAAAGPSVLERLISLASDVRHGRNRALFVDALARIDDPRAQQALDQLSHDAEIGREVRRVRRRQRAKDGRS